MNKSEVEKAKAGINWTAVATYITTGTRVALMAYGTWFLAQAWFMLTPGWLLGAASVLLAFGIDYASTTYIEREYEAEMKKQVEVYKSSIDSTVEEVRKQTQSEVDTIRKSTSAMIQALKEQAEKSASEFANHTQQLNQRLAAAEARNRDLTTRLVNAVEAANAAANKVETVAEQITTVETPAA